MGNFRDFATSLRFATALPHFLHQHLSLDEAKAVIARRLDAREDNFLSLVRRAIYQCERSPYLALLKLAGCDWPDLEQMVRTRGLESTLTQLREAGVYVTFEEFKGHEPIVRGGIVVPAQPDDFNNPLRAGHLPALTGGTTGPRLRVPIDLDHLVDRAADIALAYDAHGLLGAPTALWRGVLPDTAGLTGMLRSARFGQMPRKWFTPVTGHDLRVAAKNRLATEVILGLSRMAGRPIPRPEPVRLHEAWTIAGWAREAVAEDGRCLIRAHVSLCLRIALAAVERNIDLAGVAFMGGGEPPTPAKVRQIVATGARWIPTYTFVEAGQIAVGCARPRPDNSSGDDMHFLSDGLALVQRQRRIPGSDLDVPAFCFTSLLPSAPKILLNAESDDYGVVESRPCGCALERHGFPVHLHSIRSFRKLTGEGVTLVGSEMVRILEAVLPERFGGSALDYQLVEEEDERGFTRLSLIVSPRVPAADESVFVEAILDALGQGSDAGNLARAIWSQAGTLSVKRMEPVWSTRGKLMPLHLPKRDLTSV